MKYLPESLMDAFQRFEDAGDRDPLALFDAVYYAVTANLAAGAR